MDAARHALLLAPASFVLGHFVLSSAAVRRPLIARLGENRFRGVYSLFVTAAFAWMVSTYAGAPVAPLWTPSAWTRWVPVPAMPVALVLAVCAFTTRNVQAVGGEKQSVATEPTPRSMRMHRNPPLTADPP